VGELDAVEFGKPDVEHGDVGFQAGRRRNNGQSDGLLPRCRRSVDGVFDDRNDPIDDGSRTILSGPRHR